MGDGQSGIVAWVASVRSTLASDPAAQVFEDQIRQHGFLFLDNYLQSILEGPKREPIIELVKTPGRKKDAPKRTRAATAAAAKAKSVISTSLEAEDSGKENDAPVNSFHQALLNAKAGPPEDDVEVLDWVQHGKPSVKLASQPPGLLSREADQPLTIVDVADSPPTTPTRDKDEVVIYEMESSPVRPTSESPTAMNRAREDLLGIRSEPPNELSIIAEDDELDNRSQHISATTSERKASSARPDAESTSGPDSYSMPQPDATGPNEEVIGVQDVLSTTSAAPGTHLTSSENTADSTPQVAASSALAPSADRGTQPPSLPSFQSGDIVMVPLRESHDSPKLLNRKGSIPQFPSLRAPSPLRKSMKAPREPSVGAGLLPSAHAAGPSSVPGAKRTSWLAKAREAKAIEAPARRAQTPKETASYLDLPGSSSSLKRKSSEMAHPFLLDPTSHSQAEENDRKTKVAKLGQDPEVPQAQERDSRDQLGFPQTEVHQHFADPSQEDGLLGRLKRTVEEFGRTGKSFGGKSLGGPAAVAALAEARRAAEAKVAERKKMEDPLERADPDSKEIMETASASTPPDSPSTKAPSPVPHLEPALSNARTRLSVSDLVGSSKDVNHKANSSTPAMPSVPAGSLDQAQNEEHGAGNSGSTTPPNSPPHRLPQDFVMPIDKVFSKPPPVFAPPSRNSPSDRAESTTSHLKQVITGTSTAKVFKLPSPVSLGIPPKLHPFQVGPSALDNKPALSAQSSAASIFSEPVFDSQPSWLVPTQETDPTIPNSPAEQPADEDLCTPLDEEDEEDRYRKDFAKNNPSWTPFGFVDPNESITWTTDATESHKGDTGPIGDTRAIAPVEDPAPESEDAFDEAGDQRIMLDEKDAPDMDLDDEDEQWDEGDDADHAHVLPKLSDQLGESKSSCSQSTGRSESQMSVASSATSTSQMGFFGHAARFVSSALGSNKKKAEPVKSLQLAAAAAKKQQEEQERKTARLKEMEARRQQATQRKAEEEKARAMEEERKAKEEADKRKREREEHTEKRLLKINGKKVEDDAANKKRKVISEPEKKVESKKPPSKEKKDVIPRAPPALPRSQSKTNLKSVATPKHPVANSGGAGASSAKPSASSQPTTSNMSKDKGKAKAQEEGLTEKLRPKTPLRTPSQTQMPPPKQVRQPPAAPPPSESIELPDIDSEYSDSDDENRKRTFDPPNWAQSPNLRQALEQQSTVNPDHIFGAVRPLHMEEIFRTRQSRFRARTSSANWTGADRLTVEEQLDYARRMGYDQ